MTNFEKIDDYLANRLSDSEKVTFENQLEGDPSLKEEFTFQKGVLKGVQQARIAELKQMLNQVPVGSAGLSAGQIAATVISTGVVLFSLYYFLGNDQPQSVEPTAEPELIIAPTEPRNQVPDTSVPVIESPTKNEPKDKEEPTRESKASSPVKKPAIHVVDPSDEFKAAEEPTGVTPLRTPIASSKLEVITDSSDKKHSFHYQFKQGKLQLFGPFENNLYEILEIHGDSHAVFLYYKENYYLLDESQNAITPLAPIRDGKLLQKLKEYRGR